MDIYQLTKLCLARENARVVEAVRMNPDLVNCRNEIGDSLLDLAIGTGNVELVSALLALGADPTRAVLQSERPLISAIRSCSANRMNIVQLLLQYGADVNSPGILDGSAMHAAVAESSTELVELLLESEADINNISNSDEISPLWLASLAGDEDMVRLLLRHGADHRLRNITTGSAPIDEAVHSGDRKILSILLEGGADPNCHGWEREVPLIHAILFNTPNCLEIGEVLIHHGADVNAPGLRVASPLQAAILLSSSEFVHLLLRHGAKTNKGDGSL